MNVPQSSRARSSIFSASKIHSLPLIRPPGRTISSSAGFSSSSSLAVSMPSLKACLSISITSRFSKMVKSELFSSSVDRVGERLIASHCEESHGMNLDLCARDSAAGRSRVICSKAYSQYEFFAFSPSHIRIATYLKDELSVIGVHGDVVNRLKQIDRLSSLQQPPVLNSASASGQTHDSTGYHHNSPPRTSCRLECISRSRTCPACSCRPRRTAFQRASAHRRRRILVFEAGSGKYQHREGLLVEQAI